MYARANDSSVDLASGSRCCPRLSTKRRRRFILQDLSDTLKSNPNYQTFWELLQSARSIVDTSRGPITVLAPTDAAFAKLPKGTVDGLKKDPAKLKQFLQAHIVSGEVMIADMLAPVTGHPGKTALELRSTGGGKVSIQCDLHSGEHHPKVNGMATIGKGDIPFSGGVLHDVDAVLVR